MMKKEPDRDPFAKLGKEGADELIDTLWKLGTQPEVSDIRVKRACSVETDIIARAISTGVIVPEDTEILCNHVLGVKAFSEMLVDGSIIKIQAKFPNRFSSTDENEEYLATLSNRVFEKVAQNLKDWETLPETLRDLVISTHPEISIPKLLEAVEKGVRFTPEAVVTFDDIAFALFEPREYKRILNNLHDYKIEQGERMPLGD